MSVDGSSFGVFAVAKAHEIHYLGKLFGRRSGEGVQMAVRALRLSIREPQVVGVTASYMARLESALA
jgi:hypothetical protein